MLLPARQCVWETLVNRFQDSDVKDMNGRIYLWEKFGAAFVESPIFGYGYYSSLGREGVAQRAAPPVPKRS